MRDLAEAALNLFLLCAAGALVGALVWPVTNSLLGQKKES